MWEGDLVLSLGAQLKGVVVGEGADCWTWNLEKEGIFTVKSCCTLLHNLWYVDEALNRGEEMVFWEVWKSKVPSKVLAFSWTVFLDRVPTKTNLAKRGLLGVNDYKRCVFCGSADETVVHLFMQCEIISKVWREVMHWLNFNFIIPPNLFQLKSILQREGY